MSLVVAGATVVVGAVAEVAAEAGSVPRGRGAGGGKLSKGKSVAEAPLPSNKTFFKLAISCRRAKFSD